MNTCRTVELDLMTDRSASRGIVQLTTGYAKSVWRVLANRWKANELLELDDSQLDDIGLSRYDVVKATHNSGILDDPTVLLTASARTRAQSRFERLRRA